MSRNTSLLFRQAINAPETDQVFLVLVEISDPSFSPPIRVCNNSVDITGPEGNTYLAYNFDISLPDDTEDSAPTCKITIDNVDRALTEGIRTLTSPPTVRTMVVLASTPTVIEADFSDFKLANITYDAMVIEGNITVESYAAEPWPGDSFIPSGFPGMF